MRGIRTRSNRALMGPPRVRSFRLKCRRLRPALLRGPAGILAAFKPSRVASGFDSEHEQDFCTRSASPYRGLRSSRYRLLPAVSRHDGRYERQLVRAWPGQLASRSARQEAIDRRAAECALRILATGAHGRGIEVRTERIEDRRRVGPDQNGRAAAHCRACEHYADFFLCVARHGACGACACRPARAHRGVSGVIMPKHSTPTQRASTQAQATSAYAQFMSRAHAMELEAARRYTQFAGQQEADDNIEVAMLFRKPAEIEALHARHILAEMGWQSPPALPPGFAWEGKRGPGDGARRCAAHSDAAVSDSRNRAALQARSAEILREHRSGRRTRTR
ncbi:MAG: hypothetical protein EXR29_11605, partial [Betaproteobacteria bacterium]|nr:hypothetical protein [Betaproteobacteria bacterium]